MFRVFKMNFFHRRAVVLVYALLVLSVLLVVVTALSLYVVRQIRNAALASQAVVAHYIAEAGIEEGLYLFRHEQENLPLSIQPITVNNLIDPYGQTHYLARIASSSDPSAPQDSLDQSFFSNQAWAELFATNTISEILVDVRKNEVAYADVYDASRDPDLVGSGVGSIKLAWDESNESGWLEVSKVNVLVETSGAQLGTSDTLLLGPSQRTGQCALTDLQPTSGQSFHRLRFRALEADIRNLKVTGYSDGNCGNSGGYAVTLPGRLTINSTGRYQEAKQTVQVSMPQQRAPSGLFGFVMFSDQPLVKLNIGQGNLRWWPRPLNDVFTFKNLGNPNPSVSTTVSQQYKFANDTFLFYSGANRYPGGESSENGIAIFTLVNTAINGAIPSGEISLAINSSFSEAFTTDQNFAQEHIGDAIDGKDFIAAPPDSSSDPNRNRLMTCDKLRASQGGSLTLASYGSTGVVLGPPDAEGNRSVIAHYYTDRCAVGIKLNPTGISTGVTGRLLAYGDPGGTASMDLTWSLLTPSLVIKVQQGASWVDVNRGETINFGSVSQNGTVIKTIKLCNNGNGVLNITNAIVSGSEFSGSGFPTSVGAAACSGNIDLTFAPGSQNGNFTGSLAIYSNDPDGTYITSLRGIVYSGLRIVVTNSATTGNIQQYVSGHLSEWWYGADKFCQDDSATDDSSNWRALLWGRNASGYYLPQSIILSGQNYVNFDNENLFTASADNVVPDVLSHPVTNSLFKVWSGLYPGFGAAGLSYNCGYPSGGYGCNYNWCHSGSGYGQIFGGWGYANATNDDWLKAGYTEGAVSPCSYSYKLYCVEQPPLPSNIVVTPSPYNFGQAIVNTVATGQITVSNNGGGSLNVSSLTSDNPSVFWFDNPSSFSLSPGENISLDIKFQPTQSIAYSSNLHIISNDPDQGDYALPVTGQGLGILAGGPVTNFQVGPITYSSGMFRGTATWNASTVVNETGFIISKYNPMISSDRFVGTSPADTTSLNFSFSCWGGESTQNWFATAFQRPGFTDFPNIPPSSGTEVIIPWAQSQASIVHPITSYVPTGVFMEWVNSTQVKVHWVDGIDYEHGWKVYNNSVEVSDTGANTTVSNSITVAANITYNFTVKAYGETQCGDGTPYYFSQPSANYAYTHKSSIKRIMVTATTHDGNFEDDDGNTTNSNWYVSADAICNSDANTIGRYPATTWQALMWYRPSGSTILRPGTITTAGTLYANFNNYIMFQAVADNDVAEYAKVKPDCVGGCNKCFTGFTAWNDSTNCANWSTVGTYSIIGYPSSASDWIKYHFGTIYSCSDLNRIYCVQQ